MEVKITALLESIVTFIAPHHCILCGAEDNVVCLECLPVVFLEPQSACVFCEKPTVDWRTCQSCAKKTHVQTVTVASSYEHKTAAIIKAFKFERVRAAYQPLALALHETLPYVDPATVVVPVPTASSRVRQRGYDQAELLARELGRLRGLTVVTPLAHLGKARQVGASREQRFKQAARAYELRKPLVIKGRPVLLIDDICTTGASLAAAAALLHKAGAREVHGAVVGWKTSRK